MAAATTLRTWGAREWFRAEGDEVAAAREAPWVNPPQLAALAILDRDLAAFVEFGDRCQPGQSAGFSNALRSDATAAGFSSELRSASAVTYSALR